MALENGMSDTDADEIASALLARLTLNDTLQPEVEESTIDGVFIFVEAKIYDSNDMKWFSVSVLWADLRSRAMAQVSSVSPVTNGVPHIQPDIYGVTLKKGTGDTWVASGMNTFAYDVYEEVCMTQPKEFSGPITKAMQLLERIELGLKHKFES